MNMNMNANANVARRTNRRLDWKAIHHTLLGLARRSGELDWEIGRALLDAERARCHEQLGYGSVYEYADRLLGYAPHTTRERLRVARALEQLPETTAASRAGDVSMSVVKELTRVATPATEREWLAVARNRRVRDVEALVRGHRPGDLPTDPRDEKLETRVLRHEVTSEVYALWREVVAMARREAGEALDESAVLERSVLTVSPVAGIPYASTQGTFSAAVPAHLLQ